MAGSTSLRVTKQAGVLAAARRSLTLILLTTTLAACGGGGGGYSAPPPPPPASNVVKGQVVDAFVAGASVTAYQVNTNGTQGAIIAGPVTTDANGNYSLNLGSYTGPVYLTSSGGTYVDTATGKTVDLSGTSLVLSAIIPNASGTVTAEITPVTTMAAQLLPTLVQGGFGTVTVTATYVNNLMSNYFGVSNIVSTILLDLSQAGCATGATQGSIDASLILAALGSLANQYSVSPPVLTSALIEDISDGKWDGALNGTPIILTTTTGQKVALSLIEGNALSRLATELLAFVSSPNNACKAAASQALLNALTNKRIFTVPAAPAGVAAAATGSSGQVKVSWNPVAGANSYNLYLATAPGVQEVPSGLPGYAVHLQVSSPFVLNGLTNGTPYYFVVTAVNGVAALGSESVVSSEVSATPTAGSAISVSITPPGPVTVSAGGSIPFSVKVNGPAGTSQNVTWTTAPSGCGSFLGNTYTAPSPTTATTCTLMATSVASNAAKALVTVTVSAKSVTLTSISIAPSNVTIASGTTQQFTATGHYSDGSTQDLTTQVIWSSSEVAFATISTAAGTDGLATGVAAGTTVISANKANVSAQTNLTVTATRATMAGLSTGFAGEICALLSDGTVKCWGPDSYGSLGDGNPNYQIDSTPVLATTVSASDPAKGISNGGSTTCAALSDGTVQCWGYNGFGNLGNDTTTNSLTAVTTYSNGANPAVQVSVGLYTGCAVFHDGTAQCWGNVGGNPAAPLLGNSRNAAGSLTPVPVSIANPATAISVGNGSACVLMADTTVECWGSNTQGELGTGSITGPETCDTHPCSPVPVPVTGLSNVTMVSVGGLADVVCAVKLDGTVWCWGSNLYSQLGTDAVAPGSVSDVPVQVTGITTATAVSVGYSSACALLADGTVQCWGNGQDGQMGNGTTTTSQRTPVTVSNITTANPATAISVNENSACALLQDGTVECWGYAFNGSLGSGEANVNEPVPVPVIDLN